MNSVSWEIKELAETRRLLQTERRLLKAKMHKLHKDNARLREEKNALLRYIKELEMMNNL